jgi:hypothetical protein
MVNWLESVRAIPENPAGVEIRRFGNAIATLAANAPDIAFMNTIYGLSPTDIALVDEAVGFYDRLQIAPSVELFPHPGFAALCSRLAGHEIVPCNTYAALYGRAQELPTRIGSEIVEVNQVREDEVELFARVICAGHGLEGAQLNAAITNTLPWGATPGLSLYIATLDGVVAGAAALMVSGSIGYLANAAVLPEWRRRGVHSSMVRRRVAEAATSGCELVYALATFGSTSQRTMERAGLRLAYMKHRWDRITTSSSRIRGREVRKAPEVDRPRPPK